MEQGIIVKHNDKSGVVINDQWNCCDDDETLVVYDGTTYGQVTKTNELVIIGKENPIITDPVKCGLGKGENCCIFLTMGVNGFCCERFSHLRNSLIFKSDMIAKRHPHKLYPECQNQ